MNKVTPDDVYNADFIDLLQEIPCESINSNPPNEDELTDTIKSLKRGKAATDIPTEYMKAAIQNKQFLKETVQLYQTIWKTHSIPKSWGHSKLVAIWKGASKGSVTDEKAYRGLQVGSTLCKLLIVIIIKRIQTWYELQLLDQQQGFRIGRGTTDGIYITKRIHQITDQMKRPVYTLFIDLTAAFHHVPRKTMFKAMKNRLPDSHTKKLINLLAVVFVYDNFIRRGTR